MIVNKISHLGTIHKIIVLLGIMTLASCGSNDTNKELNGLKTNSQQEFLPVEKAFVFSANVVNEQTLKTQWVIAEGYHLYKDKFKFSVSPDTVKIVGVNFPKGEIFADKTLGTLESYKDAVEISIEIAGEPGLKKVSLTSVYQGCADVGLCYPPETRVTELQLSSL